MKIDDQKANQIIIVHSLIAIDNRYQVIRSEKRPSSIINVNWYRLLLIDNDSIDCIGPAFMQKSAYYMRKKL